MLENISLQYPVWFLLFCLLLGAIYAIILYRKDRKFNEVSSWKKGIMAGLRFLAISCIAFLLLSPVIRSIDQQIKEPIIIVAEDKSQSIESVGIDELNKVKTELNSMVSKLENKFEIVRLNFGDQVVPATFDTFPYQATDLSNTLSYIHENYVDQNVGAIVLLSDGIYNIGKNPVYHKLTFKAPIYTVALGDTTLKRDISIANILNNKISYLGDQSLVQVDVKSINAKGSTTKIRLYQTLDSKKKLLEEQSLKIDSNNEFRTLEFMVEGSIAGINQYTIEVQGVRDELSLTNNLRSFYIEVIDSKQEVLILADGPHPDVGALRNIILNNKNYNVTTEFLADQNINFNKYDLVILHNIPSDNNNSKVIIETLNKHKISRIFIGGATIIQSRFNQLQNILTIDGNSYSNEDIEAELNQDFSLFNLSPELIAQLKRYPPLTGKFGNFKLNSGAVSLLKQKIKKVPTQYPLLAFQDIGNIKSAVLMGEGLWRWRVFDFQEFNNDDYVSELMNKTIQYLTLKEDKRKFRVNLANNVFNENEELIFDAQLYNDSYELVNEPDVILNIKDDKGKDYRFSFSKSSNYYTLNAGQFSEGNYTYKANVNYNGTPLSATGKFSVNKIELEQYDLTANHALLYALSDKYNGQLIQPDSISQLTDLINNNNKIKPSIYEVTSTSNLLNSKWIFWFILGLLSIEWFLRRFYGSY